MHEHEWERIDTPVRGPQGGWYQCQDTDCQIIGYSKSMAMGGQHWPKANKKRAPKVFPYVCSVHGCRKLAMKAIRGQRRGNFLWACKKHEDADVEKLVG